MEESIKVLVLTGLKELIIKERNYLEQAKKEKTKNNLRIFDDIINRSKEEISSLKEAYQEYKILL